MDEKTVEGTKIEVVGDLLEWLLPLQEEQRISVDINIVD